PQKENLPSPCRSGGHLSPGPPDTAAQSKRLPGRLHAQERARLAFDPPHAALKLLPIKWSRGLFALFPRLKSSAAEAPSFGYFALRESELFAGGPDTLRETAFFGHSCSGNSSFITLSGRILRKKCTPKRNQLHQ